VASKHQERPENKPIWAKGIGDFAIKYSKSTAVSGEGRRTTAHEYEL
jgi:hypothetical protein